MAQEINNYTNECLVIAAICRTTRNKLAKFEQEFDKNSKKKILKILKVKQKHDREIFSENKILNEYKYYKRCDFRDFKNGMNKFNPNIQFMYENLNDTVEKTKKFYNDSKVLYDNAILYKNTVSNYKIQYKTVILTYISIIIATISLVIAFATNENCVTFIRRLLVR